MTYDENLANILEYLDRSAHAGEMPAEEFKEARDLIHQLRLCVICDRKEPPDVPGWWWVIVPGHSRLVVGIEVVNGMRYVKTTDGDVVPFEHHELKDGVLWGRNPIPGTASGE